MATDIKKFLDQAGVSTLWSAVAAEVKKVDDKAQENATAISNLTTRVDSLEKGTYDDTEVRGLIDTNKSEIAKNAGDIAANTTAIAKLNGEESAEGSVKYTAAQAAAKKVAEVVAGADASFDTLKEIADWIMSDSTGAAGMAADIDELQAKLEGVESTVVAKIAEAIEEALKVEGVDKYALASDLVALTNRVKALEDAGYQNAAQVGSSIDAKIAALNLATTYEAKGAADKALTAAKAYADGLAENYDKAGSADTALKNAKTYADGLAKNYDEAGAADAVYEKIQALTEAEIKTAIASVSAV